jgi:hypothetical protein
MTLSRPMVMKKDGKAAEVTQEGWVWPQYAEE